MKKTLIFIGISIIGLSSHLAGAVQELRALASDPRIKVVTYQENNVVPVEATTFTTTQIVLGAEEVITDIQNGDLAAWILDVQKQLPNMLFIKPTALDSQTNMTVITNKHTYYFHLRSNAGSAVNEQGQTYAVRFVYPEEEKARLLQQLNTEKQQQTAIVNSARNPQSYNWDYSFHGAKRLVPVHVFDDGQFTYLELRADQPVPAVFAVDNANGEEAVVNFRRDGQYLVIQRVVPQFTLRDGKHAVASLFNNRMITQLHYGEGVQAWLKNLW